MSLKQHYATYSKLSMISLFIGIACLVSLFIINNEIATAYQKADGKTKLWFWITEMTFNYKYYLLLPALIALIIGMASTFKNENKRFTVTAIILSLLAATLVFIKVWKVMV